MVEQNKLSSVSSYLHVHFFQLLFFMLFFLVAAILMINLVVGVIMISMMEAKAEQMNGAEASRGECDTCSTRVMRMRSSSRDQHDIFFDFLC